MLKFVRDRMCLAVPIHTAGNVPRTEYPCVARACSVCECDLYPSAVEMGWSSVGYIHNIHMII